MASLLVLTNNSVTNPLTLDLSSYIDVTPGNGLDPADPAFTQRVWSRSLLKEGATLALEQLVEREMQFPLKLGPIGGLAGAPQNLQATLKLVQQINQILETAGSTMTWQPPGASQPTTFDVLSGLIEPAYNYRAEQQSWEIVNLRVFTQPLGRTAVARAYASASAIGPLLMISPYASGGAQAIGASTQAGVNGFGGQQQGPSSGIFYWGSPSLAGDAEAQLQVSYSGPIGASPPFNAVTPYAAVSILPDKNYNVLFTAASPPQNGQVFQVSGNTSASAIFSAQAVASVYITTRVDAAFGGSTTFAFEPNQTGIGSSQIPTQAWAGNHRIFAIARASGTPGAISTLPNTLVRYSSIATVYPGDWQMLDIGTFALRASQAPGDSVLLGLGSGGSGYVDLTAIAMLPDNSTWFLNPATGLESARPADSNGFSFIPGRYGYTSTLLLDDVLGEQFVYGQGASYSGLGAPSPIGAVQGALRITQYSRGLIPRPDPKNGLPVIAILGMGQATYASSVLHASSAWLTPQNVRTTAQVSVLERTRYLLP